MATSLYIMNERDGVEVEEKKKEGGRREKRPFIDVSELDEA